MKSRLLMLIAAIASSVIAETPTISLKSIDRIADCGRSAFAPRMVFATMTITNPTDQAVAYFPEGYHAQVKTERGWTFAKSGNQCFTGIPMATIRAHGHSEFQVSVWTTNEIMRIGQSFTFNPDPTYSEDQIRSEHPFFTNIIWSTAFTIEEGEPSARPYGSPAAGSSSGQP